MAVKVGIAEGWLGYVVGFIGAIPIAAVLAFVMAWRDRPRGPRPRQ